MLVLTRKYQEKIRIGNDITITVLRTKGKAVRLGIEAPPTVPVIRGELKFEERAESAPDESLELVGAGNSARPGEASAEPSWTTKPRSRNGERGRAVRSAAEVAHRRVPREKVSEIVPRLVSGSAPLRALMEQRSTTI